MQEPLEIQSLAATEDFGEFFVSPSQTDAIVESQSDTIEASVAEAAKLLKITQRSVWRRIQTGKLQSQLRDGKTFVSLSQSDVRPTIQTDSISASVDESVPATDASHDQLDKLVDLLREKDHQLQAASFRNGYLEAQLQAKEAQIKLLTDSQHKANWWSRFKTWITRV